MSPQSTRERANEASELGRLTEASLATSPGGTLRETLQAITEEARLSVGAHQAISRVGDLPTALYAVSLSEKYAEYRGYDAPPDGSGIYRLVCEQNRTFRMTQEELERHPSFLHFGAAKDEHPPMRGWLAAPLIDRQGRNLGVIQLSDKYEGDFTEEDEAILVRLAKMASIAAENAQLQDERMDLLRRERAARAEAEEALRSRDTFMSIASHELRTPLTTLRLQLDNLERASAKMVDPILKAQFQGRLRAALRQQTRLERLIVELLDVTLIARGHLAYHLEPVDLSEVVTDVVARYADLAEKTKSTISVSAPDSLVGEWDRMRLEQIVSNLLSNALKYGPGKPIEIRVEPLSETVRLSVRDEGIGIAEEEQGKLFDRFERLVSEHHYGGLGLGLWVVREIVDGFGGTIHVDSALGEGATFTVVLPWKALAAP